LHGENLTKLCLYRRQPVGVIVEFATSSPIYDVSFRQQRKYPMKKMVCDTFDLDVKSWAGFLSCFGVIHHLSISLQSSQLPSDFGVEMYDEIPIYHAREVYVSSPYDVKDNFDAVFLAMISACRSLRKLKIQANSTSSYPNGILNESSLITCVFMCKVRMIPLGLISYPRVNLSQLKELFPKLKIF
jgi:hypothetical protein